MTNKSANARDYRENLYKEIKDIRKQSVISKELKDALAPDELDLIQETRAQKAKQESREKLDSVKDTDEYKEAKEIKKQTQELVKKIMELAGKSKEEAEGMVYGKSEETEQKEEIEGLPKLEKENFRIDSTGWKEIVDPNGVKVKENPEGDAREYLEGDYKGEQLFTKASAIRETKKAGKTLPSSWTVFRDIIEGKEEAGGYEGNYQDFLKGEEVKFCGWRNPIYKRFHNIDEEFDMWCEDGSSFHGDNSRWNHSNDNGSCGFSVRCSQD